MKKSGLVRGISVSLVAAASLLTTGLVQAETTSGSPLFPNGLSGAERSRMFMRLSYISVLTKTKSSDAYDVTGPVVTAADLTTAAALGDSLSGTGDPLDPDLFDQGPGTYALAAAAIRAEVNRLGGLGTPPGVKAEAGNSATAALSLGYWLTDDWAVEAFLLAAPLKISAYGDGTNQRGLPNGIDGKEVITTKLLPPLAILSRYFGAKDARFRPHLGLGVTYAIFYDTKTTGAYRSYVGGETSVSLSNAFGFGPFGGLQARISDDWHLNLSVGSFKLKTTATLTTRNTTIETGQAVIQDYSRLLVTAISRGESNFDTNLTTKLMQLVARSKNQSNLGTFTRKQDNTFTNTMIGLSVGRSF